MIDTDRPQITIVDRNNAWRLKFAAALRRQGFETALVSPGNDPLEEERVRGKMHIVRVSDLNSPHLRAVERISQLGGQSLVVPTREQVRAVSAACLDLKGAYTVPEEMISRPEVVARAALLMMWGRG